MPSIALDPAYRRISVEEFLEMDFRDAKAELEDGLIFMMAGGSALHAMVSGNIYLALRMRLRGTGCFPYGSDLATRTGDRTIRHPDVSVYCDDPNQSENRERKLIGDPVAVFEVLSPSTRKHDEKVKVPEYRDLPGARAIVLVDPQEERTRLIERTPEGWLDHLWRVGEDVPVAALGLVLPHAEIFSRD